MSVFINENKENLSLQPTSYKQTIPYSPLKETSVLAELQQSETTEKSFESIADNIRQTNDRRSWNLITTLDKKEDLVDRKQIVTQEDHLLYVKASENIIEELIPNAGKITCSSTNQLEKMFHDEDDDFNNLPVKARGKPNVSANILNDDVPFNDIPIVRRGGRDPGTPTEDIFDNIQIKPRDGSGIVTIPDEDPFNNVKLPTTSPIDSHLNDSDDFDNIPVKRRGTTPVIVPKDEKIDNESATVNNFLDNTDPEIEINLNIGKSAVAAVLSDNEDDNDFDNLPVKARSPKPVVVPGENGNVEETQKIKPKGVTFDLNNTEETVTKSSSLNDSDSGVGSQNSSAIIDTNSQEFGDEFDGEFQKNSTDFMNELSFLENCGDNDTEAALRQAALARKSLYVRFDPLVSNSPAGAPNSLRSKMEDLNFDDLEQVKQSKDDGVASRQQNDIASNQSYAEIHGDPFSPPKSFQKTSPKLEDGLPKIDIAKVSGVENKGLVEPLLYTQSDLDDVVRAREDEWSRKYSDLEAKIKEEIAMRELLEQDHREKMECLRKENIDMKQVVTQYEKTIVELTENSHSNHMFNEETLSETVRAKEQLQQDLHSAETNLVDAYKRIEKLKMAIDTYKSNEDDLKASVNEFQIKLKRSEERYQKLKQHAAEKVESANIEINKVRKQKEIDLAGLQAGLKKAQSKINSLEQEVQQKARENADYAQICDDLIKKVSGE